jgi:hypothetical protein
MKKKEKEKRIVILKGERQTDWFKKVIKGVAVGGFIVLITFSIYFLIICLY